MPDKTPKTNKDTGEEPASQKPNRTVIEERSWVPKGYELRVWGISVQRLEFGGFRVQRLEFGGFRVQSLGFGGFREPGC